MTVIYFVCLIILAFSLNKTMAMTVHELFTAFTDGHAIPRAVKLKPPAKSVGKGKKERNKRN